MIFNSNKQFQEIIMCLSVLRYIFKSHTTQQLNDSSKVAEGFFKTVLNITLDLNLENLNQIQKNYPAIDLGDKDAGICFQVTAENGSSKIKKTITKFISHGLNKEYSDLKVLIITNKKHYSNSFTPPGTTFEFDAKNNIWDIDDLLEHIEKLDIDKLERLYEYIKEELSAIINLFSPSDSLLRNAEMPIDLPPKNGNAFFKRFDFEDYEIADGLADLNAFYVKLTTDLSLKAREYLYACILHGKSESLGGYGRIYVRPAKIEGFLKIDRLRNDEFYRLLEDEGIADNDDDGSNRIFVRHVMSNEMNLLTFLKEMFPDQAELRDLIVCCNFQKLDD